MAGSGATRTVIALVLASASLPQTGCSEPSPHSRSENPPSVTRRVPAAPVVRDRTPFDDGLTAPDAGSSEPVTRFVVIGDYGLSGPDEANVAALVTRLKPDFVITTGDNNYPLGEAETIDENIGRYFHEFIAPYRGKFGAGAKENRFFPSLGNHDWYAPAA